MNQVTTIMAEITSASKEQSTGIDQVNNAVTQMDEVTQQNAALVEESAAAALSLVDQANLLMERVSIFRTAEDKAFKSSNKTLQAKPALNAVPVSQSYKVAASNSSNEDWTQF